MRSLSVFLLLVGLTLTCAGRVLAQQAPPLQPTPQAELSKCREYTSVLLNNSMRYEALAQELKDQKTVVEKERDDAVAKLKEREAPAKPPVEGPK
jgi:hypothetical protein